MSLQSQATIAQFARNCQTLWKSWLLPPVTNIDGKIQRIITRQSLIRSMVATTAGGIMPPPLVRWNLPQGAYGMFGGADWSLALAPAFTENDSILFRHFVLLCKAIYHELRHGEQFYRMAQGLAAGQLRFPDISQQDVTQAVANVKGASSVKEKAKSFETMSLSALESGPRAQLIQNWLGIPLNVVQHAEVTKAAFASFATAATPSWFRQKTAVGEIEDWMRSAYKSSLATMGEYAVCHRAQSAHMQNMYVDLAEEVDARALADVAATAFLKLMPWDFEILKDQPRTHLGLFGL